MGCNEVCGSGMSSGEWWEDGRWGGDWSGRKVAGWRWWCVCVSEVGAAPGMGGGPWVETVGCWVTHSQDDQGMPTGSGRPAWASAALEQAVQSTCLHRPKAVGVLGAPAVLGRWSGTPDCRDSKRVHHWRSLGQPRHSRHAQPAVAPCECARQHGCREEGSPTPYDS